MQKLENFVASIPLDRQAKQYFSAQYFKHAAMSAKYGSATTVLLVFLEWKNGALTALVWGCVALLIQLGRFVLATRALSSPGALAERKFHIVESLSGFWLVMFLFLVGWHSQIVSLTIFRCITVFLMIIFYMDTLRFSMKALLIYPTIICTGICVYLYGFNLIPAGLKMQLAIIPIFGTFILIMYGRSSYQLSHETYKVIEQNKQLVLAMDEMLIHDELTKQHNRRYFDTQLSRYFSLFRRSGQHFCVAMVDVDYFKRINDLYGHAVGDAVLVALSAYIKDALRTSDIFARYGGEEFVILLPMTNSEESVVMLDRLRATVAAHVFKVDHLDIVLTISIGVAMVQGQPEELLEYADNALYQAKDGGRNQVVLFGGQTALQSSLLTGSKPPR